MTQATATNGTNGTNGHTNGHAPAPHPFAHLLEDGERIVEMLEIKSEELVSALDRESALASSLVDAKRNLELVEADVVMEASYAGKEGPLAGVAKTSKEYGYALDALLGHHEAVVAQRQATRSLEVEVETAKANRQIAETRWSAIRHVAMLKTAMLNAVAG